MTIALMPLPYATDALAPHISSDTLEVHHGGHHKGYVKKVNDAIAGGSLADASIEAIIADAARSGDHKLYNSAAQPWNHGFYWNSLTPSQSTPSAELASAIDAAFGSVDALGEALQKEGEAHFASGWVWLVADGGALKVTSTHDADTPLTGSANPLLTIDLWEHAHYLDTKNERPRYLKAVIGNLLNWEFASENYARATPWTYPS
jgi:Fe-Mn family superoxide dismutase